MYPAYNAQLTGARVRWPESAALAKYKLRAAAVDLPVDVAPFALDRFRAVARRWTIFCPARSGCRLMGVQ